jgi:hypothetical protein
MKNVLVVSYIHDSVVAFVLRMLWFSLVLEIHRLVVSNVYMRSATHVWLV